MTFSPMNLIATGGLLKGSVDWTPTVLELGSEYASRWFQDEAVGSIDETALPHMQAQGWRVDGWAWSDSEHTSKLYAMKRTALKPLKVLNDMIQHFTESYNTGRAINDLRFDEIVAVYDSMLSSSVSRINEEDVAEKTIRDAYQTLVETLLAQTAAGHSAYSTATGGRLNTYGTARRAAINLQFDNELAKARNDLVSKGLYNSTIWTSASAGIEKLRSAALTDFEDTLTKTQLDQDNTIYARQVEIWRMLIDSRDRLYARLKEGKFAALEVRNKIISELLGFMERRTDDYPDLNNLAQLAKGIGMNEQTSVGPS